VDGETIAELFSFEINRELPQVFSVIPRTSITRALSSEQAFQLASGMTDPDTIAAIGRQLGARYVAAGSITRLRKRSLLIITVISMDDLRQIAGDFQIYTNIKEIQDKLPVMARNITGTARRPVPSALEKLAVAPIETSGDIDSSVTERRVAANEGQTFHQIRGQAFTYTVDGQSILPSTTNQSIGRREFERAMEFVPLADTTRIQHLRGPSYLYAILMDERIRHGLW
jgi:TolB-like protein